MATVSVDATLEVRLSTEDKNLIEEAAVLSGKAVADFAVSTLVENARRLVDAQRPIRLSNRDRDRLLELLDNPPKPGPRLLRAAQQHKENIAS
jgi:uncharacterized protein (DUF1778 family)